MANLRIAYQNHADTATLTADPVAEALMPVTYLQNDSRSHVWRSTSLADQTIYFEWGGESKTLSGCRLDGHNLITNDTLQLVLYPNVDFTGTPLYNPGAVDVYEDNIFDGPQWDSAFSSLFFASTAGVKSGKLVLHSPSNPAGYMQAARLFLGAYTEASYNPKQGMTTGWAGNSGQVRRDGGSFGVKTRAKWRQLAFDMFLMTEAERATWMEIGGYVMNEKTVWVSVFPGETGTQRRDHDIMGKFEKSPLTKMSNVYDFSLTLNEL